jgi:hypothetical protein
VQWLKRKKDCEAAKAIQDAAIGRFSSSPSDSSGKEIQNGQRPILVRSSAVDPLSFDSMCELIKECKLLVVQELALKKELLQEHMNLKKAKLS